ncbi:hypothetical protein GCM10010517_80570 [Streptosporangium fragile]|uniref:Uncharacterized protein n=1 Tax=Streptosporangium fragile TaxID=46186 RepID=A0ABN3WIF4_9ACTN
MPKASKKIKLPGSTSTLYESNLDPIKLASYSLGLGDKFALYTREPGTDRFVKNDKYFDYVPNTAGTQVLGLDRQQDTATYSLASVIDPQTGSASKVRITKAPIYPRTPQWSPDGKFALVTLDEFLTDGSTKPYGFAIIDIETKKAKVVPVKETDAGKWSYFWRSDGRAVGTWALTETTQRIRFYDLDGVVLQTLLDVGTPITVEGYDVSPSGSSLLTYCKGTTKEICVWSITTDGPPQATIPFESTRLVGWYDDKHIAGWRRKGSGYEAVVFDLKGKAQRVLATTTNGEDFEGQFMVFIRDN